MEDGLVPEFFVVDPLIEMCVRRAQGHVKVPLVGIVVHLHQRQRKGLLKLPVLQFGAPA